eukprot:scaffold14083_cov81-Phaeocystis_antarctica.AAC.1
MRLCGALWGTPRAPAVVTSTPRSVYHQPVSRGQPSGLQTAPDMLRRADAVVTFLELEASRQLVNVRYEGDRDFFIICSNGLDMKTLAH